MVGFVYRGYHCPVCKLYLTKLNGLMDAAAEAGVDTVVVSMDSAEKGRGPRRPNGASTG